VRDVHPAEVAAAAVVVAVEHVVVAAAVAAGLGQVVADLVEVEPTVHCCAEAAPKTTAEVMDQVGLDSNLRSDLG